MTVIMAAKVRWLDDNCNVCSGRLNSWDEKLSKTLAYKNPICEKCIAKEYDMDVNALRSKMEEFFGIQPCQGI